MNAEEQKILLGDSELEVLFCSLSLRVWHRHGQSACGCLGSRAGMWKQAYCLEKQALKK